MTEQQLPHSDDVEAALVARLLVDPAQLPVLAASLDPNDFYSATWRKAYTGMQMLSRDRRSVDVVSLKALIGDAADDVSRAVADVTASYRAPLEEYADMIRGYAFRRRLIGSLETVVGKAYATDDREALLSYLNDAVQTVSTGLDDGRLFTASQAVDAWTRKLEDRRSGARPALEWGLQPLDASILPADPGTMVVLAARPSHGKTVLAEMIADHWASITEYPVLFASVEMSVEQLMDRALSRDTGIPAERLVRGTLDAEEDELVATAIEARRSSRVVYDDDPWATTASIRAKAAKIKMLSGGLGGIVVDYLQIVKDPGDQEVQRVTKISRQIKAIAREFKVPLLVLSQLSRALESREDKHPRLSDLRESGAIEQDADVVIGLHRPLGQPYAELDVLKARQGKAGVRIELWFDGTHVRFLEPGAIEQMDVDEAREATEGFLEAPIPVH